MLPLIYLLSLIPFLIPIIGIPLGFFTGNHFHEEDREERIDNDKRQLIVPDPVIFRLNTDNLRGKDLARLRGLSMRTTSTGEATFSTDDFNVKGNVTQIQTEPQNGFIQGELSFRIPGVEVQAEGSYIMVNKTDPNGDVKLKENFSKLFKWLAQNHTEVGLEKAELEKADREKAIATLVQAFAMDGGEKKE